MSPRVGIIGGGLAGLAAAAELCRHGLRVELFEAKRRLGGRAASFQDPDSSELIDHCQHVAMGCCTEFLDFCGQIGTRGDLRRDDTLHFLAHDGRRFDVRGTAWLPAPAHLITAWLGMGWLSWRDRFRLLWALARLWRLDPERAASQTVGEWLERTGQSADCRAGFWSPILVSALAETMEQASLAAARHVFVEGFLSTRGGYHLYCPRRPLDALYDTAHRYLERHGAVVHLETPVASVGIRDQRVTGIAVRGGAAIPFDHVIVAAPWHQLPRLLPQETTAPLWETFRPETLASSPITSVHLWVDRAVTELPHAVLVGRLAQWLFARPAAESNGEHYYQVVISASHQLKERSRDDVAAQVWNDLQAVFPAARDARLLRWRMVTQPQAVFSVRPGSTEARPPNETAVRNLFVAGDWTATGWPATMEGAVRSGRRAAAVLRSRLEIKDDPLSPS